MGADSGPVPMQVGAILTLDAGPNFDLAGARELLARRVATIPRLQQRLVRAPRGYGRPYWTDDEGFDIARHVQTVSCPRPGDERALLDLAISLVNQPLPRDRPLWSAAFITGLASGSPALAVVFHHVLADGIGGVAVVGGLMDGTTAGPPAPFPVPGPTRRDLAADAWSRRLRTMSGLPARMRELWQGAFELGLRRPSRAARSSLNRPTGPRRRLEVVRADLAPVRRAGQRHGATVNDVALAAVAGSLRQLLAGRGETVDQFVVSVPISARRSATATDLGNRVGVMQVVVPAVGKPADRLARVAATTAERKTAGPGTSAAVVAPVFRGLSALGLFRWVMDHQNLVHTFVTNVRGPDRRLTFHGAPVAEILPVTWTGGNVTVAFGVASYAGRLTISIVADPDRVPEQPQLAAALRDEIAEFTAAGG